MAKNTAKCTCCGAINYTSEMVKTAMPNRGGANAYMCQRCATTNRVYHASNNTVAGTVKVNNVFVGIEFETSYTNEHARNIMFEFGFIPTHDGSLHTDSHERRYSNDYGMNDNTTCEYVTGIIRGLNQPSKFAVTAEKLMLNGDMKVNDSCGTHFHVSVDSMKDASGNKVYMSYIKRFYHSLFAPLSEAMVYNSDATISLFGRYFSNWAETVNVYSDPENRYNFINVTNDSNIEFRLNKFVNAKQYQNLMKMEVEMVKCIITNFCEHFNDTEIDSRRYSDIKAYRKHKAQVTAKKLVKLFEKYSNM